MRRGGRGPSRLRTQAHERGEDEDRRKEDGESTEQVPPDRGEPRADPRARVRTLEGGGAFQGVGNRWPGSILEGRHALGRAGGGDRVRRRAAAGVASESVAAGAAATATSTSTSAAATGPGR